MDLTVFLFYAAVIVVAGVVALLIGGAIAALLGYKLNEPEYYEAKKTKEKL
jgi:dolichol kinase